MIQIFVCVNLRSVRDILISQLSTVTAFVEDLNTRKQNIYSYLRKENCFSPSLTETYKIYHYIFSSSRNLTRTKERLSPCQQVAETSKMDVHTPPSRAGIFLRLLSHQQALYVPAPGAPRKKSRRLSSIAQNCSTIRRRLFHGEEEISSEKKQWKRPPAEGRDIVPLRKVVVLSRAHGDRNDELSERLLPLQNACKVVKINESQDYVVYNRVSTTKNVAFSEEVGRTHADAQESRGVEMVQSATR